MHSSARIPTWLPSASGRSTNSSCSTWPSRLTRSRDKPGVRAPGRTTSSVSTRHELGRHHGKTSFEVFLAADVTSQHHYWYCREYAYLCRRVVRLNYYIAAIRVHIDAIQKVADRYSSTMIAYQYDLADWVD